MVSLCNSIVGSVATVRALAGRGDDGGGFEFPEIANDEDEEDDNNVRRIVGTAFIKMGCQPRPLSSSYRGKERSKRHGPQDRRI